MSKINKIHALAKCYCKVPHASKIFEGVCGSCFGKIPLAKTARSHTPNPDAKPENLEDLIRLKSQISEKAYIKTLKVMKLLKSVSGQSLPEKFHKRSNTSNKPEEKSKIFVIPEEKFGLKKFNHLHTESHPNSKQISLSKSIFDSKVIGFKSVYQKSHERALSSRVYKLSNSPIPELRFPSIGEIGELGRRSVENSRFFMNECVHVGHNNSVNSIVIQQGKPFSAGADYKILTWPRLDPIFQMARVSPVSVIQAYGRKVNALETLGGNVIVSCANHSKIKFWTLQRDLALTSTLETSEKNLNTILAASQRTLISGGSEGITKVWDIESKVLARSYSKHSKSIKKIIQLAPSTFLSGSQDSSIFLCDIRTSQSISKFYHNGPVEDIIMWDDCYFYSAADKLRVLFI